MAEDRNVPQEVKERLNIVDVIGRYLKLRKAGKNYSGLCPFHNEKTPSFMVSEDIQRYKCFGCGRSGDIFNFIQEIETLEFPEALKKLADEAGVEYKPGYGSGESSQLIKLSEEAMSYYRGQLKNSTPARKYLKARGFDQESVEKFKVGFAPGYNKLYEFLTNRYQKPLLVKSGLFTVKNGQIKDKFINRIMFPIWSTQGKVVGFSGRNLPGDDYGPKYLNTPETPIFKKRNLLFGMYQARSSIKKEDLCIMTEGQIDVISVFSKGYENVVAPLGTGLGENQLQLVKRYTSRLLFIFDNDQAGQRALERAFIEGSKLGMTMFASNPSPYKDLDEAVQKKPELLEELLKPKQETYSYLLSNKLETLDAKSLDGIRTLKGYHNFLTSEVKDQEGRKYYENKFKELTGETEISYEGKTDSPRAVSIPDEKSFESRQEAYFMSLVLQESMIDKLSGVDEKYFSDKKIANLIKYLKEVGYGEITEISSHLDENEEEFQSIDALVFNQSLYPKSSDPAKTLNELYLLIQKEYYKREIDSMRKDLAIAEERDQGEKARDITSSITDLTSEINSINERLSRL